MLGSTWYVESAVFREAMLSPASGMTALSPVNAAAAPPPASCGVSAAGAASLSGKTIVVAAAAAGRIDAERTAASSSAWNTGELVRPLCIASAMQGALSDFLRLGDASWLL